MANNIVEISSQPPLVSVLITAYNREAYLADAIESAVQSTYQNLEIIIVDDASTDATVEIAKKYARQDSRVRLYINQQNIGDYPNRNKAAGYAKGDFLMWVDSDDIIYNESIEKCTNLMVQHPEVNFGIYYRIPTSKDAFTLDSKTALYQHFFETPYLMIGPGGTIIRREYFEKIGGFPEKYGPANDMYFNLKAACYSVVLMIPFEIYFLRKHPGQEINNAYNYLYNNYRYNRDSFDELELPLSKNEIKWLHRKNKRRFLVNIIKYFFRTGDLIKTRFAINQASYRLRDALEGIFHL